MNTRTATVTITLTPAQEQMLRDAARRGPEGLNRLILEMLFPVPPATELRPPPLSYSAPPQRPDASCSSLWTRSEVRAAA